MCSILRDVRKDEKGSEERMIRVKVGGCAKLRKKVL